MKVFKKIIFSSLVVCFLFPGPILQAYGEKWIERQLNEKLIRQVTLLLHNGEVNAAKLLVEREGRKTKRKLIEALGSGQKMRKDKSSQFKKWLQAEITSESVAAKDGVHKVSSSDGDLDEDASEADEEVSSESWAGAISHDESDRRDVGRHKETHRSLVSKSSGSDAEEE